MRLLPTKGANAFMLTPELSRGSRENVWPHRLRRVDAEGTKAAAHDSSRRRGSRRSSVTIRDVASLSGVSPATVTRALQGHPRVLSETRTRVLEAVAELGYRPDHAARTLVTGLSQTIGLLIPAIGDSYWGAVAQGAERRAAEHEFSVIFGSGDGDPVRAAHMLDVFLGKRVDGLAVATSAGADQRALRAVADIPTVIVGWDPPVATEVIDRAASEPPGPLAAKLARRSARGLPYVSFDDRRAGEVAAAHLLELGHRRIAFLGGPATLATALRLVGGRVALEAGGRDFASVLTGFDSYDGAFTAAMQLLTRGPRATAIVCFNDVVAVGTIRAARRLGIAVPDELSVVGLDDIPIAELLEPPLTTVRQPMRDLGARAVDLLLAALQEGEPSRRSRLSGELIERASTAPPRSRRSPRG